MAQAKACGAEASPQSRLVVALWALPILFAAGGIVATFRVVEASEAKTTATIEAHIREPEHPVGGERLRKLESESERTQRTLERLDRSVAAICQATGARCPP